MSAGMATKVQAMMNLNNGLCNGMWDPYNDDRSQGYKAFLMRRTMDGYPGYLKEQLRQTILNQESIFRHQLQELHRVYRRQTDLMNEFAIEAPKSSHFLSKVSSRVFNAQRIMIDVDVEVDNEGKQRDGNVINLNKKRAYNLADLNEPFQMEEASLITKNSYHCFTNNGKTKCFDNGYGYSINNFSTRSNLLKAEPEKAVEHLSRKRTLFGVHLCENSHTPSFDSSENEKRLPSWLMATKEKETKLYQMNLDSLQNHSQQFFKKAETTKVQIDLNAHCLNAENEGLVNENCKYSCILENRHQIDLNLSFDEEDEDSSLTPYISKTVFKIASMEIELEAPAAIESETDDVKAAADAIISISSSNPPPPPSPPPAADSLLRWFVAVIASGDSVGKEFIPEDMDYFEFMTLNLQETEEKHDCYKTAVMVKNENLSRKRTNRKRGKQRKDFQKDILPGIISLSRREVTEDLQTFEEAFTSIGVSWQSKSKSGGKISRGRRRLVVAATSAAAVEETVSKQVVALEEKSLGGWGKRTRRLPRQRCQNGGNHHSLSLRC